MLRCGKPESGTKPRWDHTAKADHATLYAAGKLQSIRPRAPRCWTPKQNGTANQFRPKFTKFPSGWVVGVFCSGNSIQRILSANTDIWEVIQKVNIAPASLKLLCEGIERESHALYRRGISGWGLPPSGLKKKNAFIYGGYSLQSSA